MSKHTEEISLSGEETISIESGSWAKQAHGSVVYRVGNLTLLATVCADKEPRENQDFFPLTVEYREKLYSVGRIPGGYIKREARPAEHETLTSRLIDRPIRPLFPEGYFCEVQLLVTVLSGDGNVNVAGHAISAASAALAVSDIPFHGPIAAVVVGRIDGQYVANPGALMEKSDLDLIVAGSKDAVAMIEGAVGELTSDEVLAAIEFGHNRIKEMLPCQEKLAVKVARTKRELKLRKPDDALRKDVRAFCFDRLQKASQNPNKIARQTDMDAINSETKTHFKEKLVADTTRNAESAIKEVSSYLHDLEAEIVRTQIFDTKIRADGRALDEIRDISIELDVLPGAHGSAIFTRGQTQSLGVVTLGTAMDNQRYEDLAGKKNKNFMLHYNFPPFSVGEVRRMMSVSRREVGHGVLAERSLRPMIPAHDKFPYVIRLVSEIFESNGSSSMASVCSCSLAMMAGGVPIPRAVSGIAMGLITGDGGRYAILSDIAGLEDHFGDMDFKVAGTEKGITALQLDIKVTGISLEIMREALKQAEAGRMHILGKMNASISQARDDIAKHAPRITTMQIDSGRIGELIGPGGKIIRSIIERSGAEINVEDSGIVTIASTNGESAALAREMIEGIFAEVVVGDKYTGTVKKIADFGAFIEILPGKEGLCHISKLDVTRVMSVRDVVNEGDTLEVLVIGIDRQGRIDLSRRDLMTDKPAPFVGGGREGGGEGGGGRSGGDRGGPRGGGGGRGGPPRGGDRGGRGGGDRGPRR